jgi:hypothetical protein
LITIELFFLDGIIERIKVMTPQIIRKFLEQLEIEPELVRRKYRGTAPIREVMLRIPIATMDARSAIKGLLVLTSIFYTPFIL